VFVEVLIAINERLSDQDFRRDSSYGIEELQYNFAKREKDNMDYNEY
jgi:hypothetical protein